MEFLSGVLRRRKWSAEPKEWVISETLAPGINGHRGGASARGESQPRVPLASGAWGDAPDGPGEAAGGGGKRQCAGSGSAACEMEAADDPQGNGGRIEIELPKGVRVRVIPPVDAMAQKHVLRALGHR